MIKLRIAIQMDPLNKLHHESDSSLILAKEAQNRGHKIFIYEPKDLTLIDNQLFANVSSLKIEKKNKYTFKKGKCCIINLSSINVLLIRQDPPFNINYITATYLLEHLSPKTLIINNPKSIRNAPEKLHVTHFKNLTPPTLISQDEIEIKKFIKKHKNLIVKPLYEKGGKGIFKITLSEKNLDKKIKNTLKKEKLPIVIQKYIPQVRQGDKRIILLDGNPVGIMKRIPTKNEIRANLSRGGRAEKTAFSTKDKFICKKLKPWLKKEGIFFSGIDIIGNYLTEINVTSPTGIVEINNLENIKIEKKFWNLVEKKLTTYLKNL
tara:strand:+ start:495 stop:1457 length:963 start_codon:yes stop_codon:yes gene_type:complete